MKEEEYRKRIVNYLKKNLTKGYTLESLKWALVNQGYSRAIVEKAIKQTNEELAKEAPVLKEKPKINYQLLDEYDKPVTFQKSFWRRILGL